MAAHNTTMEYLEGYEPIRVLGAGAYGIVFQASRTLVDEDGKPMINEHGHPLTELVAVKKIPDYRCVRRGSGLDFKERFLRRVCREIDILLHFNQCPQVVEIKDLYLSENEEDIYIVMAYVDISWDKLMRLDENQQLKEALAENHVRYMMCQLLLGLQALHGSGCMHRDLSLGNMLMDKTNFNCFIADFGLSRVQFDADQDISLDVVSLPYRAPEVLIQCRRYTHTVDVWSAGCVLMELMTKKPFLHAKDALRQLWAIMDQLSGFPDLTEWQPIAAGTAYNHLKSVQEKKTRELPEAKDVGKMLQASVPGTSEECADVVRKMLVFHPHKRSSVEQLLKMDWFTTDSNCKAAIEQAQASEAYGDCPSEIEGMNYDELTAHLRTNLSEGAKIVGAKPM